MAVEVEEMYNNLSDLLNDICKFLSDESRLNNMSPNERRLAEKLIQRSKTQLVEISKITDYVDMEQKNGKNIEEEEEEENVYHDVDEAKELKNNFENSAVCPYIDFPAKNLLAKEKKGFVQWKVKIFYFDKMKRFYAGIHKNWLLIYNSDKDLKPTYTLDLRFHEAKDSELNKTAKQLVYFEIISTIDKKVYQFTAQTYKDMVQWVTSINKCHDEPFVKDKLSKIPSPDPIPKSMFIENVAPNKIETPPNNLPEEEEEEDIYIDVDESSFIPHLKKINPIQKPDDKPPDLPSRRPMLPLINNEPPKNHIYNDEVKSPPPPVEVIDDTPATVSQESLVSEESFAPSSFSEDEEDEIYEVFVNPVNQKPSVPVPPSLPKPNVNNVDDDDDETENIYSNADELKASSTTVRIGNSKPASNTVPLPPKPPKPIVKDKPRLSNISARSFLHSYRSSKE